MALAPSDLLPINYFVFDIENGRGCNEYKPCLIVFGYVTLLDTEGKIAGMSKAITRRSDVLVNMLSENYGMGTETSIHENGIGDEAVVFEEFCCYDVAYGSVIVIVFRRETVAGFVYGQPVYGEYSLTELTKLVTKLAKILDQRIIEIFGQ